MEMFDSECHAVDFLSTLIFKASLCVEVLNLPLISSSN